MTGPRRPAPPPLEANDQLVTAVITAAWTVALVVLLILYRQIPGPQHWWIWTCASGLVMGLFGLWYVPRLKRTRGGLAERRALRGQAWSSDSNTVSSTETPGRSTRS
jgi:H+/Cl- antiporter ClcA